MRQQIPHLILLIWDNKLLIWDNKLLWNNKLSICWKWYWCDPNSAFDIPQKIHIHVHTGAVQEFFSGGWEGGGDEVNKNGSNSETGH